MNKKTIRNIFILIGLLMLIVTAFKYSDRSSYIDYMEQRYVSLGLEESLIDYDVSFMERENYFSTSLGFLGGLGFILAGYYFFKKK